MRVLAGRYELIGCVGRGGMGEVWEGRDRVIERRVAVKLLPLTATDASSTALFLREARAAGALSHPGVVTVFDLGHDQADGSLFLVMEFLEGRDLASRLRADGPPPITTALDWAVQAATALTRAHDAGVVHRDLKPANLMLTTDGQVKILDFGIARFVEATSKSTAVMGTLAYMPPERFDEHPGDARSDLYSFGCVLNEILTGAPPFDATGPMSFMNAHLRRTPAPPSQARPGVPGELDDLVLALLAKRPDDRPASAAQVHDRLRAVQRILSGVPAAEPQGSGASPGYVRTVPDVAGAVGFAAHGQGAPARAGLGYHFVPSGEPLVGHARSVRAVAFSPDGSLLATAESGGGTVWLWDTTVRRPAGGPLMTQIKAVFKVAFSPASSLLATCGSDGTVRMWDPASGRLVIDFLRAGSAVFTMAFSPDGSLLATGEMGGGVRVWDAATGRLVIDFLRAERDPVCAVAFSPDGSLLATGSMRGGVRVWDPASGRLVGEPLAGYADTAHAVAFSPDGSLLAAGCIDGRVRLWDPVTGRLVGEPLAVAAAVAQKTMSRMERRKRALGFQSERYAIRTVAFSPDGSLLATGCADGQVRLWDPTTGRPVGEPLSTHPGEAAEAVAFSPDGSLLAAGWADGKVQLYARRG